MNKFIQSLSYGVIAATGALVVQFLVVIAASVALGSRTNYSFISLGENFIWLIVLMGIIEEAFKFLLILKLIEYLNLKTRKALLASWTLGLGFGLTEIVIFLFNHQNRLASTLPQILQIVILHILTAGVIGYLIANRKKVSLAVSTTAIALASFFHIFYNIAILKETAGSMPIVVLFFLVLIVLNVYNLFSLKKASNSH